MNAIGDFLTKVDDLVWGVPLIVLILAAGIYLTFRLRLLQIVHLPKALRFMFYVAHLVMQQFLEVPQIH